MKPFKYARVFLSTFILLIFIDQFVYSFFFPLGCESKGMALTGEEKGYAVALKSGYSYQQMRDFIIHNPKYSIREGREQIYVSRRIDNAEIVLIIYKYELDGFGFKTSDVEKVKYDFYIYRGVSCHTPNWLVSRRINLFIKELNFPQDLENEFVESYVVSQFIPWSFGF